MVLVTDNGGPFRSFRFAPFIAAHPELRHVRTRVKTPGQNGVRERAFESPKYERLYREDIVDVLDLTNTLLAQANAYRDLSSSLALDSDERHAQLSASTSGPRHCWVTIWVTTAYDCAGHRWTPTDLGAGGRRPGQRHKLHLIRQRSQRERLAPTPPSEAIVNGQLVHASHRPTVIRPASPRADPAVITLAIIVADRSPRRLPAVICHRMDIRRWLPGCEYRAIAGNCHVGLPARRFILASPDDQ